MLKTDNLSLYINDRVLFGGVNVSLSSKSGKKVALVGRNGCGKSSLLKILKGEMEASEGKVMVSGETIGYLAQEVNLPDFSLVGEFLESKLEKSWMEYKIETVMNAVGLGDEYLIKELKNLSGGEKVKVALAGLLMDEPSVLMMDEPTNNLDEQGVEWLEGFIGKFKGSVIIVSHDRALINRVVNEIWEMDPDTKNILVFGGNYDDFLAEKKKRYEKRLVEYRASERKIKEIDLWVRAHEFNPKYRFSNIVGVKKGKLGRLKAGQIDKPVADPKIKMSDLTDEKRGLVLKVEVGEKEFGERVILKDIGFKVYKDDRILISGANGTGKTTLLKIVMGEDEDFKGEIVRGENVRIGYLRQMSDLDDKKTIVEEFEKRTNIAAPKSRSILASFLFKADGVMRKIETLSYGEKRRLDLAIILAGEPNLLILDEPTNHLDIYMREELESFIVRQNVAMLIVSHDRYFVEKIGVTDMIQL